VNRTHVYIGLAMAGALAVGAIVGSMMTPAPQNFAECLLVNAREARTADAIPAIAQACESLHPGTAKAFDAVADAPVREEDIRAAR
jgi:hypothetical protein